MAITNTPNNPVPTPAPAPAPTPAPAPVVTPPLPPSAPVESATWEVWDVYLRRIALHNEAERLAISRAHAKAQADTAIAMTTAADAQREMVAALMAPVAAAKPTRQALVWEALRSQAQIAGMTDLQGVDIAAKRVDDYLKRFPGAATG